MNLLEIVTGVVMSRISSIRLSFTGGASGCSTKQSLPRTWSSTLTLTSPSAKRLTFTRPSDCPRCMATSEPKV